MKDASQNFERYDMFNEKNGSVVLDKFRVREHCGERPDVPGVIFWPQTVERSPSQPPRVLDDVIVPEKLDPNELRPESNFIDIMTRQKIIRSKVPNNMPTVVMNVQTGQREFGVGLARYVMISHCWSQETYEKWQIPLRQACASTANLETEDWNKEKEIPRMGQYYCEASATLALVPDCRNLVQGTLEVDEIYNWRVVKETYEQSRIEVKESLWSTRGWTYQEARLSYNLCFTNSRAACNAETLNYAWHVAGLMTEDLFWVSPGRQIQANDHWQSSTSNQSYRTGTMERFNLSRPKNDHFDSREGSTFWDAWKAMVDRNTTIREDKLNALMGLVDGLQCLLGTGFSLEQMMEHLIRTRLIGVGILGCVEQNLSLEQVPKPIPKEGQVLVRIHAATLNYRDLLISTSDPRYITSPADGLVPLSDGAGIVIEVNSTSSRWKPGDRVINVTNSTWKAGKTAATFNNKVGGGSGDMDGVLQQYAVFDEDALARMPSNLTFEEAASLSGSYVTAWNALFGGPQHLKKGDVVVIQGTGGTSIAALQVAAAVGAVTIAFSTSEEKLNLLRSLGASHVFNYKNRPDWSKDVLEVTGGRGADHVIDVVGAAAIAESLRALRQDGLVSAIGFLSGSEKHDLIPDLIFGAKTIRGLMFGSLGMFQDMSAFVEKHDIKPLVAEVFEWRDAKKAYKALLEQGFVGKIAIKVD
ncbi:putative alcohol dehydrogenase [Colletotrichum karsti]|uniref:Alcohol dehydrogenase n=1 Tax=Colletotrichum karsti TaxID=1095194 RepID=A0A9P6HXT9_9PEZI|nr:putative alcohol dehydrogenase [Colletotrichum karsti]KAF9872047.1 putative alcohol dehydrogenase [Colletotrichum karsti]